MQSLILNHQRKNAPEVEIRPSGNESIIHAAANVAWSLCETGKPAELCYAVPECNVGRFLVERTALRYENIEPTDDQIRYLSRLNDAVVELELELFRAKQAGIDLSYQPN